MRTRAMSLASTAVVGLVLVGCIGSEDPNRPLPEPVPTDGPNQVVIYVPTMT